MRVCVCPFVLLAGWLSIHQFILPRGNDVPAGPFRLGGLPGYTHMPGGGGRSRPTALARPPPWPCEAKNILSSQHGGWLSLRCQLQVHRCASSTYTHGMVLAAGVGLSPRPRRRRPPAAARVGAGEGWSWAPPLSPVDLAPCPSQRKVGSSPGRPEELQTLFGELCEAVCAPGHLLKQVTMTASSQRLTPAGETPDSAGPARCQSCPAGASSNEGCSCACSGLSDPRGRRDLFPAALPPTIVRNQ